MIKGKPWEELQIRDDFLFAKVMRDKEICKQLLEKLLQTKIKDIIYLEEEKVIDIKWDAKSIRLDVYVEDGNRVFNLEMQTTNQKNLPKRSRYYGSMIDLNTIEKGESYKKLKESYVIFICTFDPFQKGMPQYTFENLCMEDTEIRLDDKTRKIFFNTTAYDKAEDADVRAVLKYVNGESNSNPFVQMLETKVEEIRTNIEWRQEYMTLLMREEEIKDETRKEAILSAILILKSLKLSQEEIVKKIMFGYQLSQEEAESYLNNSQ